jgi:site-specific DNA recombinase
MRAAGYVRVSTDEQVKHGLNLDEDRRLVREKCEAERWELVELFDDGAAQGDDPNRPELLALLDSLDRIDVVVLRSIERLSRDPMIHGLATNAFRAAGVRVVSFITGPIDIETPQGEFTNNLFEAVGRFEKRLTGQRVRQALRARTRAGVPTGGTPRYGFAWDEESRTGDRGARALVAVVAEAKVVIRIHTETASGRSQREIQRALNAEGVPAPGGGLWQQSAIARILADPIYIGKLTVRGDDGKPVVVEGAHDGIVEDELWNRVQAIRGGGSRRKGGQHAGGAHLLVRGVLRCGTCGSAMIPDRGRGRRDRYICRGAVEHGRGFCSQPSVLRERIDEPFLATLLDSYVDLEATRQRIDQRASSALTVAREQVERRERDAAKAEAELARVRGHYREGRLEPEAWNEERATLTVELEGAQEAAQRAQEHVQRVEQGGILGDAEQALLDHLARLKQAVSRGVGAAPDLHALRNLIADMFESITLARSGTWPNLSGQGVEPWWEDDVPTVTDGRERYWLFLMLRSWAVDTHTLEPIRRELQTDAPTKVTG